MQKIRGPKDIIRTTLGEFLVNGDNEVAGIYVIACYPQLGCVYVGKAKNSVLERMRQHLGNTDEDLGPFLRTVMADACGFRLDILTPPDDCVHTEWLRIAEAALINRFAPLINIQNNIGYTH